MPTSVETLCTGDKKKRGTLWGLGPRLPWIGAKVNQTKIFTLRDYPSAIFDPFLLGSSSRKLGTSPPGLKMLQLSQGLLLPISPVSLLARFGAYKRDMESLAPRVPQTVGSPLADLALAWTVIILARDWVPHRRSFLFFSWNMAVAEATPPTGPGAQDC